MASALDEMTAAIDQSAADHGAYDFEAHADAALSVARAHRDALADELEAEARAKEKEASHRSDAVSVSHLSDSLARYNAARRVRALFADPDSEASHDQR